MLIGSVPLVDAAITQEKASALAGLGQSVEVNLWRELRPHGHTALGYVELEHVGQVRL